RTSWRAGRRSASSRSCSVTAPWPPRSGTPMSQGVGCSMRTAPVTHEPEPMPRQTSPKTKEQASASAASRSRTGLADRKQPAKKAVARKSTGAVATKPRAGVAASKGRAHADGAKRTPQPGTAPAGVPEELLRIWADFKSTGSGEARELLILHYAPLVKYV